MSSSLSLLYERRLKILPRLLAAPQDFSDLLMLYPWRIYIHNIVCRKHRCLQNVRSFFHNNEFRFCRSPEHEHASFIKLVCYIKEDVTQDWGLLHYDGDVKGKDTKENLKVVTKFIPDLACTRPTPTKVPRGLEKVTKRINSEENWINIQAKLQAVACLLDTSTFSGLQKFQWAFDSCIGLGARVENPRRAKPLKPKFPGKRIGLL